MLLVHEAARIVHDRLRADPQSSDDDISEARLAEGLATLVEATANPGLSDAQYLWSGDGYEVWLEECQRQQTEIAARLLADLDSDDPDTYAVYFLKRDVPAGDRCRDGAATWWVCRWLANSLAPTPSARSPSGAGRAAGEIRVALQSL